MPTVRAAGACKTVGEDAAFQITAELPFHIGRHALRVPVVFARDREVGLQVLLDDLVEGGLLGMAAAIRARSASLRCDGHVGGTVRMTGAVYIYSLAASSHVIRIHLWPRRRDAALDRARLGRRPFRPQTGTAPSFAGSSAARPTSQAAETAMPQYRSRTTTHGRNMAGARALWRATGMTDGDFDKPIIAVANSFTQFVPGHVHLKDLGQLVAREIEAAGGDGRASPLSQSWS